MRDYIPEIIRKECALSQSTTDTEMDRIWLTDEHYILGHIIDGAVHVYDIVHNGQSEISITGKSPDLNPIPLSDLRARGFHVRLEKVILQGDAVSDPKPPSQH